MNNGKNIYKKPMCECTEAELQPLLIVISGSTTPEESDAKKTYTEDHDSGWMTGHNPWEE